jgi:hypothetical protein
VAARRLHDEPVDVPLPRARAPRRLADVDDLGAGGRLVEHFARDEPVVDHGIRLAHALQPLERDELGIARTGPDERHVCALDHG